MPEDNSHDDLAARCQAIRLILSDVDGVLTDGSIVYDESGLESKRFNVRDGFGIKLWERNGGLFGIVTGRSSQIVKMRADELGAAVLRQGVRDKAQTVMQISQKLNIPLSQTAFIGDDFPDLPAMKLVRLAATVADGTEEVKQYAQWISDHPGGRGAVRQLIDTILKAQSQWDTAIQFYTV